MTVNGLRLDTTSESNIFNWMPLAKMMLNKLMEQPTHNKIRPTTAPRQKTKTFRRKMPQIHVNNQTNNQSINYQLNKEQYDVISRFETLRKQFLYQLLVYQKELLALKMPMPQSTPWFIPDFPNKIKQKTKLKPKQNSLINIYSRSKHSKWEKIPEVKPLFNKENKLSNKGVGRQFNLNITPDPLLKKGTVTKLLKEDFNYKKNTNDCKCACLGKVFVKGENCIPKKTDLPTSTFSIIDKDTTLKTKKLHHKSCKRNVHKLDMKTHYN